MPKWFGRVIAILLQMRKEEWTLMLYWGGGPYHLTASLPRPPHKNKQKQGVSCHGFLTKVPWWSFFLQRFIYIWSLCRLCTTYDHLGGKKVYIYTIHTVQVQCCIPALNNYISGELQFFFSFWSVDWLSVHKRKYVSPVLATKARKKSKSIPNSHNRNGLTLKS